MTVADPAKLKGTTLTIEVNSFPHEGAPGSGPGDRMKGSVTMSYLKNGTFGPCVVVNR